VSAKVGPLIKEAQTMANAGNLQGALAKLKEAEAAKSSPDDTTVINQMRQFIGVKTGDAALGVRRAPRRSSPTIIAAGKWRDVIADAELLKKIQCL
jgi:hypothetical protein